MGRTTTPRARERTADQLRNELSNLGVDMSDTDKVSGNPNLPCSKTAHLCPQFNFKTFTFFLLALMKKLVKNCVDF